MHDRQLTVFFEVRGLVSQLYEVATDTVSYCTEDFARSNA
jgi:hypothetical protein